MECLTKADLQNRYRKMLLADFNHGPITKGDVNVELAKGIIEALNAQMSLYHTGIVFDRDRLDPQLTGGACSVIALECASRALAVMGSPVKPSPVSIVLEYVKSVHGTMKAKKSGCAKERRREIRTVQNAFNTISICDPNGSKNLAKEKVGALAAYYGLVASRSTAKASVDEGFSELDVRGQLTHLGEGVHVLRLIKHAENHKLEACGHTATYIHHADTRLYFDVNYGLYDVSQKIEGTRLICDLLKSNKARFDLDYYQFHTLTQP